MESQEFKQNKIAIHRFLVATMILFFILAFALDTPRGIFEGMKTIIFSPDKLITDYFSTAGLGATFFNTALLQLLAMLLLRYTKIPYTGLTLAALFLNIGFGFWGKNPINIIPIVIGTCIYAKLHKASLARYICTGLMATCLSPVVSGLVVMLPFATWINIMIAIVAGLFIGFTIPPLAMHTASMHMGYCLTNVGFASGILAVAIYCVLRAFGISSESILIWEKGAHPVVIATLVIYLLLTFLYGLWLEKGSLKGLLRIARHPGRAVADFIITDTVGSSLMNMSILAAIAMAYIFIIGGDLSGPVVGCIFILFGFGSFGAHFKNYPPILLGVFLASLFTMYAPTDPAVQIAAIFSVALAPIAGQFGPLAGVGAGMVHLMMAMCTSGFYGGLNLYNNGFSAGWVAVILVPVIESFMKRFGKKGRK